MKINLTKEQYKNLIEMSAVANSVLGILSDGLPDTDYKKRSETMEKLEEYLLQFANEFACEDIVQDHAGKNILNDEYYENAILPVMSDYDEYELFNGLAKKLAWRDFELDHSEFQIEEMGKKNGGYFGVALYDYEKKYWDEFEKYDYDRLEVVEKNEK